MKLFRLPLALVAASLLCIAASSPQIPDTRAAFGNSVLNTTVLPKISLMSCPNVPCTTVLNRAPVTNFAADLMPKFGVDRIMTQQSMAVPGETGPNGEPVFKPVNDIHDQVRFVGSWVQTNGALGQYMQSVTANDFVEFTFYGTGLNVIGLFNTQYTAQVFLDGSVIAANIAPAGSSMLTTPRNYSWNQVLNAYTGSLGLHTVKIVNSGNSIPIMGYEIINASPTITLVPGTSYANGQKLTRVSSPPNTMAYGSVFETGTLNCPSGLCRGGHVLVYQKSDGTAAKALTPTDNAAAYLTNANHANEEVIRTHNWREFGAGRADDFSLISGTTPSNVAFTLDDGTTTLVGSAVAANLSSGDGVGAVALNGFWTLTFVGTGVDIRTIDTGNGTVDANTVTIDGSSAGAISYTLVNGTMRTRPLVSGLAYGTHTIKIQRTAFSIGFFGVRDFIIYAPKTPTLPTGAVALADYFVMADYSQASASSINYVSAGVLRKACTRESVYVGTWQTPALDTTDNSGFSTWTLTTNSYVEFTFFGTGFESHGAVNNTGAMNFSVTVDGSALNAGTNVGSSSALVSSGITGLSLSAAGTVTGTASATGLVFVRVSGLTLGKHTARITQNTSAAYTNIYNDNLDIITPIHAPKNNGPFVVQNTLSIGSQSIRDLRNFSPLQGGQQKMVAQASGVATATTTSTSMVPVNDMSVAVRTTGTSLQIGFNISVSNSSSGGLYGSVFQVYVDGVAVGNISDYNSAGAGLYEVIANSITVPVSPGYHKVDLYGYAIGGTATYLQQYRILNVREQ